jgi:indolepyruvate ferredoxin oxidoreductase
MSSAASPLRDVALDDKYELERGRVFVTGVQALVRLLILQRQRDQAAGLNTAGFVSGYRGSPLGGLDQALWKASKFLDRSHIKFQPGLNEDLAATSLWGSQQVNLFPGAKYDGVFAMWYGKGPGVDRCGDAFKHANIAGTSKYGGVLALAGDDHGAKSSTIPHQSDHQFSAAMMPVLYPSSVQEIVDLGLHGFAMSRYSGCWVGFKCVSDTVESSASISIDPDRVKIIVPDDFPLPPDGVSIRWPDGFLEAEARIQDYKVYAALHYCRVNQLNRIVIDSAKPRLGIISSGKSYLDVRQALDDLGITEQDAAEIGIRVFKVAMPWPLEPEGVRHFAEGLSEILVVEEKRQIVEYQLKEQLYNWRDDVRPRVIGKFDEKGEWVRPHGDWLLPATSELTPAMIARVIAQRIERLELHPRTIEKIRQRVEFINQKEAALAKPKIELVRLPYFCSGCPHNTSTNVPEGSRATAGIGCHVMAIWMNRRTSTYTHMGAEGVPWIGLAPFTEEKHIFANLGDGTYYHSGILAIRATVAANVNITYKILYNDAVAMTGGQPVDGPISPRDIARQVAAEGVAKIVVVSDQPEKYPPGYFDSGITIYHRDELDRVQRELRDTPGTTILLYDQTCAAEKRRRRKRGTFPDPDKRVVINELVCEGCGDCGVKSNCVSVAPVETEFGRKRTIDQSSCNKDYSCANGFCPSFVTVEGGKLRKPARAEGGELPTNLPDPVLPSTGHPYGILVTGIGGTGVVTIGALLGMAAHIEGKGASVLDMTGLAQKNGAVLSHVRIGDAPDHLYATRIAAGDAKLVLACDILTGVGYEALAKMQKGVTKALVNTALVMPAQFTRDPDLKFPTGSMEQEIKDAVGAGDAEFIDATRTATGLMGDSIATNLFMVGYAYQRGLLPLSEGSILRAIELNAAAVDSNKRSFYWGRLAAVDPARVAAAALPPAAKPETQRLSQTLDEIVSRRVEFLTAYQDSDYAARYSDFVAKVRKVEAQKQPGATDLTEALARYYFKLLAIKDEYEVARLYAESDFVDRIKAKFEGDYKLSFHLAPPTLNKPATEGGEPRKSTYGPWMMPVFRVLAKMRRFRGSALDVFGRTTERKMERKLISDYETLIAEVLDKLTPQNYAIAVELASIPEHIRGYGHVKERHLREAKVREGALLARFREGTGGAPVARPVTITV